MSEHAYPEKGTLKREQADTALPSLLTREGCVQGAMALGVKGTVTGPMIQMGG